MLSRFIISMCGVHGLPPTFATVNFKTFCKSTQLGHKPHCSTIKASVFTSTCSTDTVSLHNYNCGVGICRVDVQRCVKSLYEYTIHMYSSLTLYLHNASVLILSAQSPMHKQVVGNCHNVVVCDPHSALAKHKELDQTPDHYLL